jgi:SAM-dependent methyltransferase
MLNTSSPMGSDADIRAWIELEKTETGNVGADIVVNPALYATIVSAILGSSGSVVLADFGGGTASLSIDLLAKDPASKPALSALRADLQTVRKRIRMMYNIDLYDALLQRGEERKRDYGAVADTLRMVKANLGSEPLPFANEEIDIAVSRQFLMHLTKKELHHHFREAHRVLTDDGWYIATILNPARDFIRYTRKYPEAPELQPEQQYVYEMEHAGLKFSQISTFRPLESYMQIIQAEGFSVEANDLFATIPGYEELYPSYYDTKLPMAVLLKMRKQKQ